MERHTSRMEAVQSPIISMVGELIRSHPGTISLGQGVVYYNPPPQATQQITQFFADPQNHKYKAVQGIPPLLEAIAYKLKAENGISVTSSEQIVVTAGSNMGFMNAILAITSPGDEIILPTPYYFNHEMAIRMASCHPVLVPMDEQYQLCPDAIQKAITNKTRAVVTISPNNPTGSVYSRKSLETVNEICKNFSIYHISDEAYEYFTYDGAEHFSSGAIAQSHEHTISLFSLSKAYGFASWRIGYMVIPEHLFVAIKKIQDTILICPPVISQYAAMGALEAGVSYCREQMQAIAQVRQHLLQSLDDVRSFCTIPPTKGAFYCFLKVHTQLSAMELVEQLIRKYAVAVIPGDTFGMKDGCYLRVAYGALSEETASEGIGRLVRGLQEIIGN